MSTKEPELLVIEETNFPNAWAKGVRNNLNFGFESNNAKEHIIIVRLTKNAINQVLNHEVHPMFPSGTKFINAYCEEYTYEYLEKYLKLPEEMKFSYLYFERFAKYKISNAKHFDQIAALHNNLRNSENSRQLQMITYIPEIDAFLPEPPCLQRIQVRQISDGLVDLHYELRSWDYFGAMPTNIIAVTEMMKNYILEEDYDINSINVIGRSAHVYNNDSTTAKQVNLIPKLL